MLWESLKQLFCKSQWNINRYENSSSLKPCCFFVPHWLFFALVSLPTPCRHTGLRDDGVGISMGTSAPEPKDHQLGRGYVRSFLSSSCSILTSFVFFLFFLFFKNRVSHCNPDWFQAHGNCLALPLECWHFEYDLPHTRLYELFYLKNKTLSILIFFPCLWFSLTKALLRDASLHNETIRSQNDKRMACFPARLKVQTSMLRFGPVISARGQDFLVQYFSFLPRVTPFSLEVYLTVWRNGSVHTDTLCS